MRIRLSNTQVRVIENIDFIGEYMITKWVKGANAATFKRLHALGLITEPMTGAALTARGLSVWAGISSDPTARSFFLGHREELDYTPHVVKPLPEAVEGEAEEFKVTVIRLNGDENIHRTGCGDIKRAQQRHGIFADEPWDMTVKSWRDCAEQYWGDIATDTAPDNTPEWLTAVKSLHNGSHFHACLNGMGIPEGDWQRV